MYPYSLRHLLLTAMIFILIRSDAIIFLPCFTKNIFKKQCDFQNPGWSLPWSHLKSTKLWSCHLLILMSEAVKCHSESARSLCMNMEKRGRRAAKSERTTFYTKLKMLNFNENFNCFHSFLVFHLRKKKGKLNFTEIETNETESYLWLNNKTLFFFFSALKKRVRGKGKRTFSFIFYFSFFAISNEVSWPILPVSYLIGCDVEMRICYPLWFQGWEWIGSSSLLF